MFTSQQCHQLQTAVCLLKEKNVLQTVSPPAVVCLLALLAEVRFSGSCAMVAERLNWSEKRTHRYLQELVDKKFAFATLGQRLATGQFTPRCYQLVSCENPSESQPETPTLAPKSFSQTHSPFGIPNESKKRDVDTNSLKKALSPPDHPSSQPGTKSGTEPDLKSSPENKQHNNPTPTQTRVCVNKNINTHNTPLYPPSSGDDSGTGTAHATKHELTRKLKIAGLSQETSCSFVATYPVDRIQRQLNLLPYRNAVNPAALLVKAIKDDWSEPQAYLDRKAEEKSDAQAAQHAQEKRLGDAEMVVKQNRREEKLRRLKEQMSSAEKQSLLKAAQARVRQRLHKAWPMDKPVPDIFLKAEFNLLIEQRFDEKSPETQTNAQKGSGPSMTDLKVAH